MTIYELAEIYDTTIINIVQEIKSKKLKVFSKQDIEDYERKLNLVTAKNKKTRNFINRVNNNIKSGKYTPMEELTMLDALDDLKVRKKVTFKTKKGTETYEPLIDYSYMKNTLNKMKGKDFYYRVNDGFSRYKISRSEILSMQDNSFFINKMKEGIEKAIEKTKKSGIEKTKKEKKIKILENTLLPIINFNSVIDSHGTEEISKLPKKLRDNVETFFSKDKDKKEKNGKYPILVQIFGNESIEI